MLHLANIVHNSYSTFVYNLNCHKWEYMTWAHFADAGCFELSSINVMWKFPCGLLFEVAINAVTETANSVSALIALQTTAMAHTHTRMAEAKHFSMIKFKSLYHLNYRTTEK